MPKLRIFALSVLCLFLLSGCPRAASKQFMNHNFRMDIISDDVGRKHTGVKYGRPFVTAVPGERYSVRLYNPLPVPVAVNLTIDGLNSITGRPCTPEGGRKWIIKPYSSIVVSGWQVSSSHNRRFFFTGKEDSYAAWRSNSWARDLSVNCGVIAAAFFWSKHELFKAQRRKMGLEGETAMSESDRRKGRGAGEAAPFQAGTGMGEQTHHPVETVDFHYDAGMYNARDALIIYYDFAPPPSLPRPFQGGDFAPEMPR